MADAIEIREAHSDEIGAIVALAGRALGWDPAEPNRALFEWKHLQNPFGPSALLVAVDGGELVGLRALMRWEFSRGDGPVRAVRPVDTATHPDHQGRGIFRRLTEHAIEVESAEGVAFAFNTPNQQSRPGYLRMGWQEAGRVPTRIRPLGVRAPLRIIRARRPAEKWSLPTPGGDDPVTTFTDDFVEHLAGGANPDGRLATVRHGSFLRWRYGLGPLHYRAVSNDDAVVVFRRRRRGAAIELAITDLLARNTSAEREVLRQLRSNAEADYALAAGEPVPGMIRLLGQGPVLTSRRLAAVAPSLDDLCLRLGDIELF
ncbi:MAG: GNAT family N-acetyltransferase [Acidimicrobiia bacterium]|nr:GNAT family N-acetyltransferase [Acidimicrobiia bacterium]